MNLLRYHTSALKNVSIKAYLTPVPILAIFVLFYFWFIMINSDSWNISLIFIYTVYHIVAIITYPFSISWIESTRLFKMIFRNAQFLNQLNYNVSRISNIRKSIKNEYVQKSQYIPGGYIGKGLYRKGQKINYVDVSDQPSRRRANEKTHIRIFIFLLKDVFLRLFIYYWITALSPFIFLIAVPRLNDKGILQIEKENTKKIPKKILISLVLGILSILFPQLLPTGLGLLISLALSIIGIILILLSLKITFHQFRIESILAIIFNFFSLIITIRYLIISLKEYGIL